MIGFAPMTKGSRRLRPLVILISITAVLFLGIGMGLHTHFDAARKNFPPSPMVDVIDSYDKTEPADLIPDDYAEACAHPRNPIVAENCRAGTEDWVVHKDSLEIQGFASSTSVNTGETIRFYIDTTSARFDIAIFRLGYYAGKGGRLIESFPGIRATRQPHCQTNFQIGLTSCSNWSVSFTLAVPAEWVSGVYMAKLAQADSGGENYIIFVVRDDGSHADILYQQSVTTYQAYNNYGGKSLYNDNSNECNTVSGKRRAIEVSFDRPYDAPMGDPSTFFIAEYPMVRWLEAQGYWVTYSTDLDTDRSGRPGAHNALLDHKTFLSVGHDEYWSRDMRNAVTAARDAGVNIGIFSGNTSYWSVRMAPDPWSGDDDRTMVAYKTIESGGPDPSGMATSTWRDPNGPGQPENALLGIQYIGDNESNYFPLRVYAEQASDPLLRNTGLENIPAGEYVDIGKDLVGWEWDGFVDNGAAPPGVTVLFKSPVYGELLQGDGANFLLGQATAETAYYQAPGGSFVFNSGTILWSWGLDLYEPDPRIRQITYNVLARMGVFPATPAPDLVVDGTAPSPKNSVQESGPKTASAPPLIQEVLVDTAQPNQPTIRWQTDKPATSQVWYWLQNAIGCFDDQSVWKVPATLSAAELGESHQISLRDLAPGRAYRFAVISQDSEGNIAITAPLTLQVPQGGLIQQLIYGFQSSRSSLICKGKPVVMPIFYWLAQLNAWLVAGLISMAFLLLGVGFIHRSRST